MRTCAGERHSYGLQQYSMREKKNVNKKKLIYMSLYVSSSSVGEWGIVVGDEENL
jgi:hypothetical protein